LFCGSPGRCLTNIASALRPRLHVGFDLHHVEKAAYAARDAALAY
jgi:hypothetical protein